MKTNLNAFLFLAVLFLSAVTANAVSRTLSQDANGGYYINMPASGSDVLTITQSDIDAGIISFKVYDNGGSAGYYGDNSRGYLKITVPDSDPDDGVYDYIIAVSGVVKTQNYSSSPADYLTVYDGTTSGTVLINKVQSEPYHGIPTYVEAKTQGNVMTLYFESNGSWNDYDGLDLLVQVVNPSKTFTVKVNKATGGTLTANQSSAVFGTTIKLTPTVSTNYLLNGIDVVTANNEDVKVNGGYWYFDASPTFAMPYSNVTVKPKYVYKDDWTADGGLYIDMPQTGTLKVSIPANVESFKVYDDGGFSGKHSLYSESYAELTAPEGHILRVTGNIKVVSSYYANLTIFDGEKTAKKLLDAKGSSTSGESTDIGRIVSSGRVATLYFHSSPYGVSVDDGLDLKVEVLDASVTHNIMVPDDVTADVGNAAAVNTSVKLTVTPPDNKTMLVGINVDANGEAIEVNDGTWASGNVGSFKMPYEDVLVTPVYTNNLSATGGLKVYFPTDDSKTLSIPSNVTSFMLYNEVDEDGNYTATDGTLVLAAEDENSQIVLSGKIKLYAGSSDKVTFFDSDGVTTLFSDDGSNFSYNEEKYIDDLRSGGNKLTVKFESDRAYDGTYGLELKAIAVNPNREYSILIPEEIGCGNVSVVGEKSKSVYGETVELTLTPGSNCYLGGLEIESNGEKIPYERPNPTVSAGGTEVVTFKMPNTDVSIKPHFVPLNTVEYRDDGSLGNFTYFHMECGNNECVISQEVSVVADQGSDPGQWKSFKYWYRGSIDPSKNCEEYRDPSNYSNILYRNCEFGLMDVYRTLYYNYEIKFVGSIDFGGYDSDAGKCTMLFEPFTGMDFYGNTASNITISGEDAVIEGMCQMDESSNYPNKGIAYANSDAQSINVSGITLINPYIDSNHSGPAGAVVAHSKGNVTISDVHVKNAVVKGPDRGDYVVGGLLGSVGGNVSIENSSFEGTVSSPMIAGGLVGSATSDNVDISNSSFEGKVTGMIVGGIVGSVSISSSFDVQTTFAKVDDSGSIVVSGSNTVGGIVGGISLASGSNGATLSIKHTYSIGDISGSGTAGYIIGSMNSGVCDNPIIQKNYHYGNDAIELGVGGGSLFTDVDKWKGGKGNIKGNFRNSLSGLTPDGFPTFTPSNDSGYVKKLKSDYGYDSYANGVISDDDMKTARFAAILNGDYDDCWSQVKTANETINDGLPFFAYDDYKPNYAIGFNTDMFSTLADEDASAALKNAVESGRIVQEYCGSGCSGFVLATDYTGHLAEDDLALAKTFLDENSYWFYYRAGGNSVTPAAELNVSKTYDRYNENRFYMYAVDATFDVVYYVCNGYYQLQNQGSYNCVGEEREVKSGADLTMFDSVGFSFEPPKKISLSDFSMIPLLVVSLRGEINSYSSEYYRIPKKGEDDEYTWGTINGKTFSELHDITTLYNLSEYDKTLYILYSTINPMTKFSVASANAANTEPEFSYIPLAYNVYDELVEITKIDVGSNAVDVPMTAGFRIARAGYTVKDYEVVFENVYAQNTNEVNASDEYLVSPATFDQDYNNTKWKKTFGGDEVVRLDSIHKGVISGNSYLDEYIITIAPTYKAIDYNVVFDIKGTDSIAINMPNYGVYRFGYEVYAPKDLTSLPTSYNLEAQNKNLPMLYAVTQNSAGAKMYASVWTGDSAKSHCVMRESNCAASPNANSVLSSEQIEDAGDNIVEEEGKDPTLTLYPVWAAGTSNDPNYLIIDCDGEALCERGELFTLKLTQNVTIAGNEYELQHNSAYISSNNFAGPSIPLPLGVAGNFEFTVNFDVTPGYEVDTTHVVFDGANATYENGKLTLNLNQAGNVLLKGWTYAYSQYTVSFDLDQLIDNGYKYVFLDDDWTTSKKMDLSSEKNAFPKVYALSGANKYVNVLWNPDSGSVRGVGTYSLDSTFLKKINHDAREFKAYPAVGEGKPATRILIETYDANGDLLTKTSDYHGRVVLSQNADPENENNKWIFEQQSVPCEYQKSTPVTEGEDKDYVHCLYIPYQEGVFTFKVSLVPDAGYAMELNGFEFKWRETSSDEPEDPPAGYGYNAENDTLVIHSVHMGMNMDTMLFKVKYTVTGPFYVKYNLNTLEEDEDKLFLPSDAKLLDTLTYSETKTSRTLWKPYRTDKCFAGWYHSSSVPEGSTDGALTSFDAEYAATKLEADSTESPTVVYAIWKDCAGGPTSIMTVANGGSRAKIKLKQTFGDKVYAHVLADEDIALGDDTYLFTVDTVGSMEGISEKEGYLSATSVAAERDGITFSEPFAVPLEEMTLVAKPRMAEDQKISPKTIYTLSLLKDEYLFVYDKNTEANVFFMTEAIDISEKYISRGDEFITAEYMGRADACLDGWSLAADGVEKYTELNDELLKILDNEGYEEPVKLYAVWDESCDQEKFTISMSPEMEDFGKYKVYYVMKSQVYLPEDTIWFDVGKDGLEVPTLTRELGVKFVSTSVYNVDSIYGIDAATYEIDHDTLVRVADGEMFEIADGQKNLILYSPVQLLNRNFVLDVNAESNSVFFGTSFMELSVYAEEGGEIPMAVYRNGYKLAGWSLEKDPEQNSGYDFSADPSGVLGQITGGVAGNLVYAPKTHQIFNKSFEEDYVMYYLTYQRTADTLYAVWEKDDDPDVWYVVNKDPNKDAFTFRLTQEIGGEMFEHLVADSLAVPAVDGIEFRMEVLYDHNDFEIDGKSAIVVLNEKGDELDILENDSWIGLSENIGLKANVLRDKRVQLKFNENSKDSLFHGSDWIDEVDFDQDSAKSVELPTLAYNAEKCLAGWTTDTTSGKLFTILNDDLLSDLRAKSAERNVDIRALLYAKWTTNLDSCAGEFMKLAVEQENGTVWFAEADKKKTIERRFTDEGTMFVPRELDGSRLKVQASGVDTSVYVLDSLVVLRNDKVDTVLFVGDYMPEILDNVALKAYFGWKNKTEVAFVDSLLKSSGSVFKLSFKASDFEVRRRVVARVLVDDIGRDTTVIDTVLGDSIEMGYGRDFIFRMKRPGNYKMLVTLKDKADSIAEYTEEFSVSSEISSIAVDSWQMLSLAAVDMSTVKDDGDQIFYWWDEYGTGEFWQYKRLDPKDSVAPTLGVWYNSLEGRSLTLLSDAEDEGEDFTWKLDSANTGWNMVANPHSWTLDLYANHPDVKKNFDEESEISFWRYNAENAEPEPVDTIGPYEAVWAKVSKKTKWNVSADPFFTIEAAPLEKRALAKAVTRDRWTLQAILTDKNGKQDSWNILGAGLNPFAAEEPPESMGDHVNLSIVDGKRALAKSIKESDDEMEWTIALSASSNRVGYLSFAGIEGVNGFGYRVFVTIDGNTTEMQEGVPLTVFLKSTAQTATVRVAPTAKMLVQNTLKGLRMARLGNQLRVSFEASEGLAGTKARVDLMDMKGHVISTVNATAVSGTNALVLDTPQSGLYMLRVRAGSEQQATKVVVK